MLTYDVRNIEVTDEEIQQLFDDIIEFHNTLQEDKEKTTVEEGDFVTISYEVRCGGKLLESVENKVLQVGAGNFDKNIESKLIGAQKGTPYSIDIPKSSEEEKLEEEKKIIIFTVEKIQYMESVEITDDFIKEKFGANSVNEFYEQLKETRKKNKKKAAEMEGVNQLLIQAIEKCDYSLDENEILDLSLDIYNSYSDAAKFYGISLEEYTQTFMDVSGSIYEECYSEAEEKIKKGLLIGAIAFEENISEKGGDFEKWAEEKEIKLDILSEEVIQDYQIEYVKTKVEEYLKDLAKKED